MGAMLAAKHGRFDLQHNSMINVTPFVDVMLVLLIIFMVAIPAATVSLKLDLPPAKASAQVVEPTVISLQRDGALFIGQAPTSLGALSADLQRVAGAPALAGQVYVRAERGVRYGSFMAVVSQLHAGGFQKVGLVNEDI
jgi:biopolymer transport protein ExbD